MATSIHEVKLSTVEVMPIERAQISHSDAAQYIEEMCVQLAELSERTGLGFLSYLLEVAREEASLHTQDPNRTLHGELPPL